MYVVPAPLVPAPADWPEEPAPLLVRPLADVSPALLPPADDESRPAEPALLPLVDDVPPPAEPALLPPAADEPPPAEPALLPPPADVVSRSEPELVPLAVPEPVVVPELELLLPPMADAPAPVDDDGDMRAFASTYDVLVVDDDVPDGD